MEQLHTVEQTAELLQLHPDTIRLWLRSGRLQGRKLGRVWRVPDQELRRLGEGFSCEPGEKKEQKIP